MLAGSSTTAATTSGPAQAPRPASSMPATGANPARPSTVSYAPGPALQPGDGDGPGEAEGQRQGGAGGLDPGRQESAGVLSGRRGRRGRGGGQPGLLEAGGNRQDPPPADRPDDDEGPADHGVL